jgi:diguanylate cyclase (GGDEF)-like protein
VSDNNAKNTEELLPDLSVLETSADKRAAKILVVDDSVTIRAGLTRALVDELTIVEAVNGEDGWTVLQENEDIELVITDLDMPVLNGYDLIKRIRNSEISRIANIPVIVVTGAEDLKAKYRAFVEGANDFISKNSDRVELMARVRAHQKLAQTIRELEASRLILKSQADTDSLTKLTNRRSFFVKAEGCLELMRRHKEHFSVLMVDIDHFKIINDTYGHQAGDYILTEVAKLLSNNVRTNDVLARIGGEEFTVALPYSNRLASIVMAERLRSAISSAKFTYADKQINVTISLGVASMDKDDEEARSVDELLAIADRRLYAAKRKGRNRLCASDDGREPEDIIEEDSSCPKVDDALTMISHGNEEDVRKYLYALILKTLPLFKTGNEIDNHLFDLQSIEAGLEELKKEIELGEPDS